MLLPGLLLNARSPSMPRPGPDGMPDVLGKFRKAVRVRRQMGWEPMRQRGLEDRRARRLVEAEWDENDAEANAAWNELRGEDLRHYIEVISDV